MNDLVKQERQLPEPQFHWPHEERVVRRWVHAGLHCAVAGGGWSFCGYVLVPKDHPDADKDGFYMEVDVHGGLTFSQKFPEGTWFGWDAGHCWDEHFANPDGKRWLIKDMIEETNRLAEQIAERGKPKELDGKEQRALPEPE